MIFIDKVGHDGSIGRRTVENATSLLEKRRNMRVAICCFLLGAAVSWLTTYLCLTHERRIVAAIRSRVGLLAAYHALTPAQQRQIIDDQLLSDKEYWDYYLWACRLHDTFRERGFPKGARRKLRPTFIAAETIICKEILGLTSMHAVNIIIETRYLNEIEKVLADTVAKIGDRYSMTQGEFNTRLEDMPWPPTGSRKPT